VNQLDYANRKALSGGLPWWVYVFGAIGIVFLILYISRVFYNWVYPVAVTPGSLPATPLQPNIPGVPNVPTPCDLANKNAAVGPSWWNSWGFGALSNDPHDATQLLVIPGKSVPLSAGNQGFYGLQWWMYVKDWSYGYGKDKDVVVRANSANPSIVNPKVSLHPTDNVLRFTISVFPTGTSSGSSTDPAAANDTESAVANFTCEVPDIPLQKWFAVSMTVFERNLDVYIDGKLVKSCFMSGVPKPVVSDVQITPNGGYSGLLCGFSPSATMLNPSDANNFFLADTACRNQTGFTSPTLDLTGYLVKFGLYDTTGKEIQEYTF
jgi:hypothetical protein